MWSSLREASVFGGRTLQMKIVRFEQSDSIPE